MVNFLLVTTMCNFPLAETARVLLSNVRSAAVAYIGPGWLAVSCRPIVLKKPTSSADSNTRGKSTSQDAPHSTISDRVRRE